MKVRNRIKVVCAERDILGKELAKGIGATQATVSNWFGNHHQPSLERLGDVAIFLDVDVRELIAPIKS